jgi:small basic protein
MGMIRQESPVEYFKEMIEAALEHQRVQTGELTSYYLVNLLAGFAGCDRQPDLVDEPPLGVQLIAALKRAGAVRNAQLRKVGDRSLFISGFFSDSLKRQLADVDYYVSLGAYAYHSLSEEEDDVLGPVFAELGRKFVSFVDVLEEVSERSAMMSNHDLLRLYEKWLRTGSRRDGELLAERGIVPNKSIGEKFVQ